MLALTKSRHNRLLHNSLKEKGWLIEGIKRKVKLIICNHYLDLFEQLSSFSRIFVCNLFSAYNIEALILPLGSQHCFI